MLLSQSVFTKRNDWSFWLLNCHLVSLGTNLPFPLWAWLTKIRMFSASSLFKWIILAFCLIRHPCYCLVLLGIIYITHMAQAQTVMLISLMNICTQKDTYTHRHKKKRKAALVHNKQPESYTHALTSCVLMMLDKRRRGAINGQWLSATGRWR